MNNEESIISSSSFAEKNGKAESKYKERSSSLNSETSLHLLLSTDWSTTQSFKDKCLHNMDYQNTINGIKCWDEWNCKQEALPSANEIKEELKQAIANTESVLNADNSGRIGKNEKRRNARPLRRLKVICDDSE